MLTYAPLLLQIFSLVRLHRWPRVRGWQPQDSALQTEEGATCYTDSRKQTRAPVRKGTL